MSAHAFWPIEPAVLAPFAATVALIELTPGPNMGYLAALSASEGRGAGFRCVLGVTLGLSIYMIAATLGVTELIAASPPLYGALRWAGVAYLFYLAWESWRGVGEASSVRAPRSDGAPFWRGFIANILNPKAAVFYVTVLSTFVALDRGPYWIQALLLGGLQVLISVIVHSAIVIGAARGGLALQRRAGAGVVRRSMALGIAMTAVWLAWETGAA